MMTIHKVTAGDGYTYLTKHIAGGDVQRARGQEASDYYTAKGNPVGYWIGRGAPALELAGKQVSEEQMRHLFGAGMHPDATAIIADYLAKHVTADTTDAQLARVRAEAVRAATLGNPAILLLDGAELDGDPYWDESIERYLDSLRGTRTTVIWVPYSTEHIRSSDQMVIIEGGQVRHVGPPVKQEVREVQDAHQH